MLGTVLAFALASAQFTMSNGQPRTQATKCDALYYGLGRAQDLTAAFRCYGADGDFQMQIIMALNGDGVRRSVRQIDDLFNRWERKDPGAALSGQNDSMRVALGSLRAGSSVKHLVFCEDVGSSTLDSMRCDSIRQFQLEADTRQLLRRVAGTLSNQQKMALENLHGAFDRFKEAEGSRGFQAFITGSIRHTAGALQEDYVRQHFVLHLTAIVGQQQLAPSTGARLQSAASALETVYEDDLVEHENRERDAIGIGTGYRKATTTAKQAWDEYRRAWIGMVNTLSFSNMKSAEAVQAIEALLTIERIDELKNNILGVH